MNMLKPLKWLLYPLFWRFVRMPGRTFSGALSPLNEFEQEIRDGLKAHVERLAGDVGDRSHQRVEALKATTKYVSNSLWAHGYEIAQQELSYRGVAMNNVIAEIKGRTRPSEIIVIGAHYDTVAGCPGADDNASGVAALIELARMLRHVPMERTVRFVAFANEEDSGGPWESMGSYHYARLCKQRRENVVAMLSLEMLGYYSDAEGSQKYPFPFNLFYPSTGNFIGFVGDVRSATLVRRCVGMFRKAVRFPSEGAAAPSQFKDINRSDHWSFWQMGYSALMVTDTSNFRNPYLHTTADTPDKLDYDRMARVVRGLAFVVKDLAGVLRQE